MPAADVEIDARLVRRLVDSQAADAVPGVGDLPLVLVAEGWDNVVHRLGDDLAVRMPRRRGADRLLLNEARWLPVVARDLAVATPQPVFVGHPAEGYPFPWLVCRWVGGTVVADLPLEARGDLAPGLADALVALHRVMAPDDAPANPWRGVPLADRAELVRQRILGWDGEPGAREVLLAAWDAAVAAPPHPGPARWLHGDPHPLNLVEEGGLLSGLLDFGDVTSGDPASDLATAWWTFGPADRQAFRARVDAAGLHDLHVWTRAAGWAASFASAMEPGSPLDAVAHHTARQLRVDRG